MVAREFLLLLWNMISDLDPFLQVILISTYLQFKVSVYLLWFLRYFAKNLNFGPRKQFSDPRAITVGPIILDPIYQMQILIRYTFPPLHVISHITVFEIMQRCQPLRFSRSYPDFTLENPRSDFVVSLLRFLKKIRVIGHDFRKSGISSLPRPFLWRLLYFRSGSLHEYPALKRLCEQVN